MEHLTLRYVAKTLERQSANFRSFSETHMSFATFPAPRDSSCDFYFAIPTDTVNNFIQITAQKDDYTEIEGVFSFSAFRTTRCSISSDLPDTLHFRNGRFHVYPNE